MVLKNSLKKWVIYVKVGVWSEYVEVLKFVKNMVIMGDGIGDIIVMGSRSVVGFNFIMFVIVIFCMLCKLFYFYWFFIECKFFWGINS